ncbi:MULTISPECIES: ABC transporter permease [unclassified Fusibacter]|uniref:ABC transporter permease n=1 Tax=unclassified Fusibacter TaxID=2624464 RepID=UPI001011B2F2|nr:MULTISPECIES: FtsX-like permease family protein [unclassified Fusibacter]MCK8058169.1 FtsX-like permease family protein [Fusibacter sp. A2]NPE20752.1 FtsX-like permease family protein [Fusibacter sp. A1]RXV62959.1 ABC transporter permease [Fusibacter sp. A1]
MIKNNNSSIINKMIINSLINHKARSVMTMLSVILTCVLLTSAFTITASLIDSSEKSMALQVGSSAHGGFKRLTEQQVDLLKDHHLVKAYGVSTILGIVEDERLIKRSIEVRTMDENYRRQAFVSVDGDLPVAKDEIILDTITLDLLDLPHEPGQNVTLQLQIGDEVNSYDLKLIGVYEGNIYSHTSFLIMSEAFKASVVTDGIGPNMLGANDLGIEFANKFNTSNKFEKMISDKGMNPDEIKYGTNWAYVGDISHIQIKDLISYGLLIGMLMMSGYLIIYNIYLIAVQKDINYYGLLKTVGTTQKQIKKIVFGQAMYLLILSLPVGLAIGYFFGVKFTPLVLETLNLQTIKISFNGLIFLVSGVLTTLTVLLSCAIPAKVASGVSPIEAVKSVEVNYKYVKQSKRRKQGNRIHQMAWQNLFRVKRKAIMVVMSLSLSLLVLNGALMLVASVDPKEHLDRIIGSDYLIGNAQYFTYNNDGRTLSDSLLDDIDELGVVTHAFSVEEHIVRLADQTLDIEVYHADTFVLEKLTDYVIKGEIGTSLEPDQIVIDSLFFDDEGRKEVPVKLGDSLQIEGKEYEIVAVVDELPLYLYDQSYTSGTLQGFIHSDDTVPAMTVMVEGDMESSKEALLKMYPYIVIKSRFDYIEEIKGFLTMIRMVGYSLSGILALIGIMNFINMTSTGILVRKREFAVMQSVGMTSSQLKGMLYFEGLYVLLLAVGVTTVLSIPLGMMVVGKVMFRQGLPLVGLCVIYYVIVASVPRFSFKVFNSDSLMQRLNVVE